MLACGCEARFATRLCESPRALLRYCCYVPGQVLIGTLLYLDYYLSVLVIITWYCPYNLGTLCYLHSRYRIQQGAASSSYILDQTSRTTIAPPDTGDPGRRELYEHSVQLH